MKKSKKTESSAKSHTEAQSELSSLTADLQRLQADFVNYRRRVEEERKAITESAKAATVSKLLPVIDNIELATKHLPPELAENNWAKGIAGLYKSLEKSLAELNLRRIPAEPGTQFDPTLHEAVMLDEASEGDEEVIDQELRSGYMLGNQVLRHSMVKVKRQAGPPERQPDNVIKDQLQQEEPEHIKPED